jgi:hypothetical protein
MTITNSQIFELKEKIKNNSILYIPFEDALTALKKNVKIGFIGETGSMIILNLQSRLDNIETKLSWNDILNGKWFIVQDHITIQEEDDAEC